MMESVLKMIKEKHFFNMDKNILRGCMEDLTYMYCPGDDINKDRVLGMLEPWWTLRSCTEKHECISE